MSLFDFLSYINMVISGFLETVFFIASFITTYPILLVPCIVGFSFTVVKLFKSLR